MKGDFAINKVIEIVLVVGVLGIVIAFFWSRFWPASSDIEVRTKIQSLCQSYVSYDKDCDGQADGEPTQEFSQIKTELTDLCSKIKEYEIKKCCELYCMR